MLSKKTGGYIMLALIMAVMIPVIVFITRSFSMTCQDGYHWDKTAKKCVATCSGTEINQPTLDYKCGQCPKDYIVNTGLCVKSCRNNADCPKSSTGFVQNCVNGVCTDQVWTCNKKKNGSVCEPLEGDIPSGSTIYSNLKDCITSGSCKCDNNWEWNASMDACNTYSCTKNALDGWGSNIQKGQESTPSTLFSPYQQSDGGTCLPVTDDGTPGAPSEDGVAFLCMNAKDRESCFRTGSDDNKLSCRWFPDTVCNRIMPQKAPWDSCRDGQFLLGTGKCD